MRRTRADSVGHLRDAAYYAAHLWWRLPRGMLSEKSWMHCQSLGAEFLSARQALIEDAIGRHRLGVALEDVADELCEAALRWARARTKIDFAEHEPSPY